jgi:light-regulated signal transduction histidine kinase (bacteriophytochrome)
VFGRSLPHELGTPLLLLEAYCTVLQDTEVAALSPRGRKYLERMRSAAAHLRSLGTAVLAMAPLSTQPMRWQRVDLSWLAWQVIDVLRDSDRGRKVETSVEPGMSATGDPDLLRTLLTNLIANAWKFSGPRPVAHITIQTVDTEHGRAICVADDGVGFDMQHVARLFTPFGRIHGPAEFAGSGLGLCIAHAVVERHSGRVWAHSVEGQGARFYFWLGAGPHPGAPAPA